MQFDRPNQRTKQQPRVVRQCPAYSPSLWVSHGLPRQQVEESWQRAQGDGPGCCGYAAAEGEASGVASIAKENVSPAARNMNNCNPSSSIACKAQLPTRLAQWFWRIRHVASKFKASQTCCSCWIADAQTPSRQREKNRSRAVSGDSFLAPLVEARQYHPSIQRAGERGHSS